jgi:hypothetical protein
LECRLNLTGLNNGAVFILVDPQIVSQHAVSANLSSAQEALMEMMQWACLKWRPY